MLVLTDLREEGLPYLHTLLNHAGHLGKALAKLPVDNGRVWTWLPADLVPEAVNVVGGSPKISAVRARCARL
jgi:hypothetical protein